MVFNKKPKKTFLVHGEPEASQAMADLIQNHLEWEVEIPKYGESFELEF
jgi:metallo-beta-lactamase family protein